MLTMLMAEAENRQGARRPNSPTLFSGCDSTEGATGLTPILGEEGWFRSTGSNVVIHSPTLRHVDR
jgi:hypothetical protein